MASERLQRVLRAMGDFGIPGLWLLLALALIASVLVAAASLWLVTCAVPGHLRRIVTGTWLPLTGAVGIEVADGLG
jgi:hypothetical protein